MNWMIKMILANMKKRRLRTCLTMLGIVIGVLSIMLMTSVGIGMKTELMKDIESMGSLTELTIYESGSERKGMQLSQRNIDRLLSDIKNIENVYPCFSVGMSLEIEKYQGYTEVVGVPLEYLEKLEFKHGELDESKRLKPVIYIGGDVMRMFFNEISFSDFYSDNDMDKRDIDMSGRKFKTIIYMSDQEYMDDLTVQAVLDNHDYRIYCDIDELIRYMKTVPGYEFKDGEDNRRDMIYNSVIVKVDDIKNVDGVLEKIREKGFLVESNKVYADQAMEEMKIVQVVLGLIGGISFLVAIIGIINTMTTSVYDRIKEIGVLKVLGCDPYELQAMFLTEAGIMGFTGGLIGVLISYLLSGTLVNKICVGVFELAEGSKMSVIPWWLGLSALAVSTIVGMAAGYFPSRYVRKLTPINSMKHE